MQELMDDLTINGYVGLADLPNKAIYKANVKFVEYVNNNGFPLYDCGKPLGATESGFYNMELQKLFNE